MAFGVTRDPISGAIRQNYAAAGAKRYGANGSFTATEGAVDPAGYDDREMRKRARRRTIQRRMQMDSQGSVSTPLGGAVY
jgi:hypothetical protein